MKPGLVLIDIQNDYFTNGKMELVEMDKAATNATMLLDAFRKAGLPIFHIQHQSVQPSATFFLPDTHGVRIHESVLPLAEETVIVKNFPNSFLKTSLQDSLKRAEVQDLVICGAMSHMCIDSSTRAAFDLGYNCLVAEDGCTTKALVHNGMMVDAKEVHAAFMAALASVYAAVMPSKECLKKIGLDGSV